jgi:hypothetical protein
MDNIKWISPAECARTYKADVFDVTIAKDERSRLKISIQNPSFEGMLILPRLKVGLDGGRMYFKLSDTEGFATSRTEHRTVVKLQMREDMKKFLGKFMMHRSKDNLLFINAEENGVEI